MSTFDGNIKEFPDIQVDFFRRSTASGRPPLACFLSHVHSDHLVGLEALRSPFVYCSAATRALVLRLERFPCRVNYAKGILEARKRTYKDQQQLLKPLPLETPVVLELAPGNTIRVTLLDANHCPGSVMFLFENTHHAVLYTGDTRCEPWFVNALVRSPALAEYTTGLRVLDTVYLDTTFLQTDVAFPAKADGLRDLLRTVSQYPPETVFHFQAWTFGYENVWLALSKALDSKVHVDKYKMRLYESLAVWLSQQRFTAPVHLAPEAPALVGFLCGNATQEGCLVTDDDEDDDGDDDGRNAKSHTTSHAKKPVRIHSCDRATSYCAAVRTSPVVWIRPVVRRQQDDGVGGRSAELAETNAGGGADDLSRAAELDAPDQQEAVRFCQWIKNAKALSAEEQAKIQTILAHSACNNSHVPISLGTDLEENDEMEAEGCAGIVKMQAIANALLSRQTYVEGSFQLEPNTNRRADPEACQLPLPQTITFSYSRHSSYAEQCDLLDALRPGDVWPCTVNPDHWFRRDRPPLTIRGLFGQYCSGDVFRHDKEVGSKMRTLEVPDSQGSGESLETRESQIGLDSQNSQNSQRSHDTTANDATTAGDTRIRPRSCSSNGLPFFYMQSDGVLDSQETQDSQHSQHTQDTQNTHDTHDSGGLPTRSADTGLFKEQRRKARRAILHNALGITRRSSRNGGDNDGEWMPIGLVSTTDNHTVAEIELGCG